jgi:3-oxoacyl-[acyl-carrier protein] reductase
MSQDFREQVAIITGGASGIGRETALLLAERQARAVVIADVDAERGPQVARDVEAHGARGLFVGTDVTVEEQVVAMVRQAHSTFGRIDILLNAAGSPIRRCGFLDCDLETWEACMAQNLRGSFLCAREVLRHMVRQRRGNIVNMASVAAYLGNPNSSIHYAVAKGGTVSLTVGMAREFAPQGIRVNALAPGAIDTPFHTKFSTPEFLERIVGMTPVGRMGTPREVAELIAFICSDACRYMTGAVIRVDGGMIA